MDKVSHPRLQPALEGLVGWILSLSLRRITMVTGGLVAAGAVAVWAAATAYGRAMAGQVVMELARPVTDSLGARLDRHDTLIAGLMRIAKSQARLQESVILAQRQADPKFDSAIRKMAEDTDARRRQDEENRDLLRQLADTNRGAAGR